MKMQTSIEIGAHPSVIWNAITDIENAADMVSEIISIDVLHKPESGFVGFKWKELRKVFGKEAEETMWITEADENAYYRTRAESHGSIYQSEMRITPLGENRSELTMSFEGTPQTLTAKLMSVIMMPFFKGSMVKLLEKDLLDIKQHVEGQLN